MSAMKFVFFGYDFMMDSVERLAADGHELIGIFSFECDNIFNFNTRTQNYAVQNGIPISLEKPTAKDIAFFTANGAGCFLSAGYPYKIPPIDKAKACGINFHPSLLPKGRGIMPTPYIIMQAPEASGITVHKLTEKFDQGDILYQEELPLSLREDVETLSARIALRGPDILSMVLKDLPTFWKEATPQNEKEALHFPPPTEEMRVLDWSKTVSDIDKTGRAFGRYGSLARFDGLTWAVFDYSVWKQKHKLEPGTVALRPGRHVVIAAQDGFVYLKEFQELVA